MSDKIRVYIEPEDCDIDADGSHQAFDYRVFRADGPEWPRDYVTDTSFESDSDAEEWAEENGFEVV